ncbi:uncharacterized protein LOC123314100 [Coccinella septempunctata]|uniref:uncharacterized protein LOC123314100 n=1 Tax=Coccinella septempunctata TaxID=41139 RepID=UPI001D095363|nr:uncharacterized protein LOC123314100 [Coccinella septempunctata]
MLNFLSSEPRKYEYRCENPNRMIRNKLLSSFLIFFIGSQMCGETSGEFWAKVFIRNLKRNFQFEGQTVKVLQLSRTLTNLISSISVYDTINDSEPAKSGNSSDGIVIKKIEEKVRFQLFNELVPNGVYIRNARETNSTNFLDDAPIKFITHGWLSGGNADMCQTIKDQYLSTAKVNVVIVHWDYIALSYLYIFVVRKLKLVAAYYADFLERLIELKLLDPEQIHLIGHSLGPHLSGQVGKRLLSKNMKIGRITGLDPAFPGYQKAFGFEKLSREDATFVDVIHTCGGALGILNPIGHVDFYPNGGSYPMPGCHGFWSQKQCSHSRSWQYFAESIIHPFIAVKCESFGSFRDGKCLKEFVALERNISTRARGSYYFSTSDAFPYTLGTNGTVYIPSVEDDEISVGREKSTEKMFSFEQQCDWKHARNNKNFYYTKEVIQAAPPINFSLANISKSDVSFNLHQDNNIVGIPVNEQNIASSIHKPELPAIVLIHGWSQYITNPWYENFIRKYFELEACNVICVYWSPASSKSFLVSSANTKSVGKYVADFLVASTIPTGNIHIISHSLGAHVAGFAGKMLIKQGKGRFRRITGLDPAAPTIDNKFVSEAFRLSSGDADFVDVYHTDAGFFGFTKPIGHVDFYPNYGREQPGCPIHKIDESAHHLRAISYFEETINCPDYKAYPANISLNGYEYQLDVNFQGERVVIGEHVSSKTRGIFYFKTNDKSPFLIKN